MPVSGDKTKHWANRYLCISKIGNGAFGTAFKVRDNTIPEGHGSIKVLKEIPVENMDQDEIDDCAREGKLLSKLSNDGIVQFFDSFCYGESYCIITEFCEGGDLNQLIVSTKKQGSRLEEKRVLRWFIQIMQALNYIHKRKILHRDLKTRNIFLKKDSIKIGDFGISRILNCTMDMASTFVGTPFYMSPEVLKHDGYNAVSDVWSAGVILYEMCALKHAYDGQGIMAVMYKIVEGPCPTIPDYYSTELQNVLERVMVKDPMNRPTAAEVLQIAYLEKIINDIFLDLNHVIDLNETIIKSQTKDINEYISQPNTIKTIKDISPEDTLTPKEKMALRKKEKADKEAEEKSKVVSKIYLENREFTIMSKQKSTIDSLPFSMRRQQNSVTLNSSYDENYQRMKDHYESSRASGSKTIIPQQKNYRSATEYQKNHSDTFPGYREWKQPSFKDTPASPTVIPISQLDKTFSSPSQNQYQMYSMQLSDIKYENPTACVTTFDDSSDAYQKSGDDIFYEEDFSSSSNGSESDDNSGNKDLELPIDTTFTKFKDDEEKDPYGLRMKNLKITTMKGKCLDKISKECLAKALKLCVEFERKNMNYSVALRKTCKSDEVAMLVDQLHFLMKDNANVY